jgi:hypothetical protein
MVHYVAALRATDTIRFRKTSAHEISQPFTHEVMTASPDPDKSAASPPGAATPGFKPREMMGLYAARRFDELSEKFLGVLAHYEQSDQTALSPGEQHFLNAFTKHFLYLFTQADFEISERHARPFLARNLTISNLVAVSSFRTTDAHLELLRVEDPNSFTKVLTLFSARNSVGFDRRRFFDLDPVLASFWYSAYCQIFHSGLIGERVCRNLREHFEFRDDRLTFRYEPQEAFFGSTYLDGECDRLIKPVVNRSYRQLAGEVRVRNSPNPRKIAILSGVWAPKHSVYRNYAHYVRALRGKYHLTFVQLGDYGLNVDESAFDEILRVGRTGNVTDIAPIISNDFQVAYFPDVGMTPESIALANMRLAPIQMASPGHSVSTFGAEIDYFISGATVEVPDNPERHYSERLVLLPDCGVIHNRPLYEPRGGVKSVPEFVINCPAFSHKMNARYCRLLQRVIAESKLPLRIRLFVGSTLAGQANVLPFQRELHDILRGARIEVIGNRTYENYMALMEEGDISIDSFHFGGCNTIADSLFLRIPTVTYEGDKWYNRIGSQMLRMAGVPELIAENDDEYVRLVTRLIHDDAFRAGIRERLVAADLDATIFNAATADCFRKTVDFLIENHERLSREPERRVLRYGVDILPRPAP